MTTLSITLPFATRSRFWGAARAAGLVLTVVLLAALWRAPTSTLHVLWNMVVPLLPAVFLVNPIIWRNVCPLASLNAIAGKRVGDRFPGRRLTKAAWIGGLVLLGVMVPARRFLFNENGLVLLVAIAAAFVAACAAPNAAAPKASRARRAASATLANDKATTPAVTAALPSGAKPTMRVAASYNTSGSGRSSKYSRTGR